MLLNLHHIQLINKVLFSNPEGMRLQICLPSIFTHKERPEVIHIHLVNKSLLLVDHSLVLVIERAMRSLLLLVFDLLRVLDILFQVIKLQIFEKWV